MGFWIFGKKDDAGEIKKLRDNLNNSFSNIKKDFESVHGVLSGFKDKHEQHDKKHEIHSARFDRIENDITKIYEILEQFDQKNLERSIVHERSSTFNRSNQSFMNVQSLENLKENLTPAQKRVIQLLDSTEIPLEYEDIAKELGVSIITIRRHMNDMKKMGFRVKERFNIDTKRKVFYLEKEIKRAIRRKK